MTSPNLQSLWWSAWRDPRWKTIPRLPDEVGILVPPDFDVQRSGLTTACCPITCNPSVPNGGVLGFVGVRPVHFVDAVQNYLADFGWCWDSVFQAILVGRQMWCASSAVIHFLNVLQKAILVTTSKETNYPILMAGIIQKHQRFYRAPILMNVKLISWC